MVFTYMDPTGGALTITRMSPLNRLKLSFLSRVIFPIWRFPYGVHLQVILPEVLLLKVDLHQDVTLIFIKFILTLVSGSQCTSNSSAHMSRLDLLDGSTSMGLLLEDPSLHLLPPTVLSPPLDQICHHPGDKLVTTPGDRTVTTLVTNRARSMGRPSTVLRPDLSPVTTLSPGG
jgi:hypothetical protein